MNFYKRIAAGSAALFMATLVYGQNNTPWSTTGNIGIGTTSPGTFKLNIQGAPSGDVFIGGSQSGSLTFGNANWAQLMGIDSSNIFYLQTNNTRYFTATWDANLMSFGPSQTITINNGNVGIGLSSPAYKLDIKGSGARVTDAGGNAAGLDLVESSGGRDWALLSWGSAAGGGTIPGCFSIYDNTAGAGHRLFIDKSGNVGIGTTTPSAKLSVNGTIHAKEIIVDSSGADYVFDRSYPLESLPDLEAQIKSKKHLPGIPSAEEMKKSGLSVGELETILLEKVEELTLHQIEQEKEIARLKSRLKDLEH